MLSKTKERVLNAFEARTDDWSFGTFEKELLAAMAKPNANYQDAKTTIAEAHKLGRWPKTVARYVLTNYKAFGSTPGELINVATSVFASMTPEEKAKWAPKHKPFQ